MTNNDQSIFDNVNTCNSYSNEIEYFSDTNMSV